MIVAVQIVFCVLKEVLHSLLSYYHDGHHSDHEDHVANEMKVQTDEFEHGTVGEYFHTFQSNIQQK